MRYFIINISYLKDEINLIENTIRPMELSGGEI